MFIEVAFNITVAFVGGIVSIKGARASNLSDINVVPSSVTKDKSVIWFGSLRHSGWSKIV